jgi:hypothetical protein
MGDADLQRCIVSFETFDGKRTSYSVVVWYGRDKAVALAAAWHSNRQKRFPLLARREGVEPPTF